MNHSQNSENCAQQASRFINFFSLVEFIICIPFTCLLIHSLSQSLIHSFPYPPFCIKKKWKKTENPFDQNRRRSFAKNSSKKSTFCKTLAKPPQKGSLFKLSLGERGKSLFCMSTHPFLKWFTFCLIHPSATDAQNLK